MARSTEPAAGPETQGGYLMPGEFELTIGYRHQFSFRHFVGSTEQIYRAEQHTQVMNKINLENFNLTYQITPRLSVTADVPLLLATRHPDSSSYSMNAEGIGDIIVTAQSWLWDPRENSGGNVLLGFGFMAPTGNDNVQNTILIGGKVQTVPVDYSIQPGSGGWGIVFNWQSFKALNSTTQVYFNGDYIATPQNTNGVLRYSSATPNPLTAYNSISDEYLMEAGVSHAIRKVKGLSVSFGPRDEGVPAKDLIGKSDGFRRPGYAVSLEPGVTYVRGKQVLSATVGRAIYRDRTRSVPDRILGTHGDAAFADWLWLASYSFRFGGHHDNAH